MEEMGMHMWMWFGYDLGDFLFAGLTIDTRWSFALTWIVLFFVAFLFEGFKVYLAAVQRNAKRKLFPYRTDERRNLLCEQREAGIMEPSTSRNASSNQVSRWSSLKVRVLVNLHQALMFVLHNVIGYLLMLAVMIYNVHLMLSVIFGMMLGYFIFGPKLTTLQMKCLSNKKKVICTPECDDTAENTTPPLLDSSIDSESDFFICQTRSCIQPSHYFPARTENGATTSDQIQSTCYYGAKHCPSKVARVKKMKSMASSSHYHQENEKEDSPSVEDVQLLRTERQGCCKKNQEPPPEEKKCCKKSSHEPLPAPETITSCCKKKDSTIEKEAPDINLRENSPQIMCCHQAKTHSTDSQEKIVQ